MAESVDDKQVDDAITRMQTLLDELKGVQAKDVKDEAGEEQGERPQAKTIREITPEYIRVRAHTRARSKQSQASGA